jgi:hypothetical protein
MLPGLNLDTLEAGTTRNLPACAADPALITLLVLTV